MEEAIMLKKFKGKVVSVCKIAAAGATALGTAAANAIDTATIDAAYTTGDAAVTATTAGMIGLVAGVVGVTIVMGLLRKL